MHRKEYILIAKVIKELNFIESLREIIISAFCSALKEENASFNEQKFRDYISKGK